MNPKLNRFDPNPSWVADPNKYGKQVAVRFEPAELKMLDDLVEAKKKRDPNAWRSRGVTRSSTVTGLVKAAHAKLLNDRRRNGSSSSADVEDPSDDGDTVPEWQAELEHASDKRRARVVRRKRRQSKKAKGKR